MSAVLEKLAKGTMVIYYNGWDGFEADDIRQQFIPLSQEEIQKLQPGDRVFVDVEPYHHGKVYGYAVSVLGNITKEDDGKLAIAYDASPSTSGLVMFDPRLGGRSITKFARVEDEAALAKAWNEHLPHSRDF